MNKPKRRCYRLFQKVLIICCIEITYEKCETSEILGIVTVNLLTRSSPVEFDADRKNQEFKKCFA